MSTQITIQKILAFDNYTDLSSSPGIEGYVYIDKAEAEAYLWDSDAAVFVRIGADTPIPPDPPISTFVDAATTGILSFLPNYYNGPSNDGVGATLTATQVGVLRDNSGVGKIDSSYVPVVGGLILVKNQTLQYQNGIYVITNVGSPNPGGTFYQLTRVADFDQASELFPLQVNVLQGTVNANQYFNQATPSPLVIGTSNLVFSPANYATAAGPIAFVDVATTTALPACVYANGTTNPSYPGLNATLTASAFGTVLTVDGLTASTSATPLGTFTRVLVKNQANKAHNGDYIVVNGGVSGSSTVKWQLRRINYAASGFYRFTRYFLVSNTQASLAGKIYITKQQNPALTNLGIGTQLIDLVEYGGASVGPFGIANTSGVYTYYASLPLAMAAAIAGQTIEMFADVTTGSNVSINLKNGVNINGNGHTYKYSNSLGNCFQDNGASVICSINNLTISRTSSLSSGANVLLTGNSRIDFTGSYIYRDVLTDNYACIEIQGAARVFNAYCLNEYGRGIWSTNANSLIENSFGQTIQNSGYGIMSHGNVIKSTGIAVDLQGIFITTTTGTAINCIGISTSSQGIRGNTTNCTGISTSGNAIGASSASTHRNSTGITSSNIAFSTGAVVGICNNCTFETTTGTSGVSSDNGQYYNCSIAVLGGTGTGIVNAARVINCSVRVTNAGSNCLTASGARTTNYLNNVWIGATTPVNALITQGTVNTQDNQGNILM